MPTCSRDNLTRMWSSNESLNAGSSSNTSSGFHSPGSPISLSPISTSPDSTLKRRRIRRASSFGTVIQEPFVIQSDCRDSRSQSPTEFQHSTEEPKISPLVCLIGWYPCFLMKVIKAIIIAFLPHSFKQLIFAVPIFWFSMWFWCLRQIVQLPLTIFKFALSLLLTPSSERNRKKRTVLISGGSTIQALHLARNFYSAGARVVVCEVDGYFALARFSMAVSKFYTVPKPTSDQQQNYVRALCEIVDKENAVYYIPVSATTSAYYDAVAKPHLELLGCTCFCPGIKEVWALDDTLEVLRRCDKMSIRTPVYYPITSKEDVDNLYETGAISRGRYTMSTVGPSGLRERAKIHLPISRSDLKMPNDISVHRPWVVVQDVEGDHYFTCTTVKESKVIANVTCRLNSATNDLIPVENKEISLWLNHFFGKLNLLRPITGHISFRFVVSEEGKTIVPLSSRVGVSLPYICYTSVHPRLLWKPQTETAKRDVEQKLASVVSTLRRIAGIQIDGTVNHSSRLLSPSRRWSPARTASHEVDNVTDIDPEIVRKGVRNLMQQVAQIERERDDFKTQVGTVKKQLKESNDNQNKGDSKLTKVLKNLRSLQDEKGTLETKLGQKTIALNSQTDALHKKSEEVQQLRDKITNLELSVSSCKEEKMQFEDKVEKYKNALGKLDAEKRALQEELARTENRSSKLELQRMSAEGDLQRLQMMLQEKDAQIQKLQEKCETQSRNLVSLEERCISLKTTIDQLNSSLERAAGTESEMKVEIQSLQRSLLETTTATHTGAEKLKHLHKSLASSENERKILSERFEASQQNLNEFRRNNQILQDQVSRLNNELANNEVVKSGLESQLRLAQWPETSTPSTHHHEDELIRQLQRDRSELRSKVETLTVKVRQVESENRDLERTVTKCRSKSYERPEKYEIDARVSDRDSVKYEQENAELRMKISKLEMEVGDKEAELARLRNLHAKPGGYESTFERSEVERYRAAQLQAERLLEAREQSHRQQVARLENQVTMLREQLNQEIKRRQQYILRSSRAGREMQHLRQALGDSLRTVSQDPSLDALLLEQEARKLDNTATNTASLPPALNLSYDRKSVGTPQPPNY